MFKSPPFRTKEFLPNYKLLIHGGKISHLSVMIKKYWSKELSVVQSFYTHSYINVKKESPKMRGFFEFPNFFMNEMKLYEIH